MKKHLISFLTATIVLLPLILKSQTTTSPNVTFATVINDLKTRTGVDGAQVMVSGLQSANDENGGTYMWRASSTSADNGFTVIQVTGVSTGRWHRVGNSNTIKGQTTFSGTLLQTSYVVPLNLPFVPNQVYIQARSANAAQLSWVSNITATSFTINFLAVPIIGTNNMVFDWLVIKQ